MKKVTVIWLITAAALCLSGLIIFGGVMTMGKWDFSKLSTVTYETNEYEISEEFKNISVTSDTSDIVFAPAEDSKTTVVCREQKKVKHFVNVKDGTLEIRSVDTRKWYEHIGIMRVGSSKITVYLPLAEYEALTVKESTGDVEIPKDFSFRSIDISVTTGDVKNYASASGNIKIKTTTGGILAEKISAESIELSVTTGNVKLYDTACQNNINVRVSTGKCELKNVSCNDFTSMGSTGSIHMKGLIAAGKIWIERDTGAVRFDGCDAAELLIRTDTGDVTGSLLTEKVFFAHSDTGDVDVPKDLTGGRCEINTDTGDIRMSYN